MVELGEGGWVRGLWRRGKTVRWELLHSDQLKPDRGNNTHHPLPPTKPNNQSIG